MGSVVGASSKFSELLRLNGSPLLSSFTLKFLDELRFEKCSPVQQAVLPQLLSHKDVVVQACTGSGKTLAFLIPLVQTVVDAMLKEEKNSVPAGSVRGLIMVPVRELAGQIHEILKRYLAIVENETSVKLTVLKLIGKEKSVVSGNLMINSLAAEGRSFIVVGTPGRVACHLGVEQKSPKAVDMSLSNLEMFILDEADQMLRNVAFKRDLLDVMCRLPRQRRTGLFSATMTDDLKDLARTGLRNAVVVKVGINNPKNPLAPDVPTAVDGKPALPSSLKIFHARFAYSLRTAVLMKILKTGHYSKLIVFLSTCDSVEFYFKVFTDLFSCEKVQTSKNKKSGTASRQNCCYPQFWAGNSDSIKPREVFVVKLTGHMDNKARMTAYQSFCSWTPKSSSQVSVMFATDVASRGLDFPDVSCIVQFEPPQDPALFIHRAGRTARSHKSGDSILFLNESEEAYINYLESFSNGANLCPLASSAVFEAIKTVSLPSFSDSSAWELPYACPFSKNIACRDLLPSDPGEISSDLITDGECRSLLTYLKLGSARDRAVMELAQKAFVSSVRAYKEHKLEFLFPFHKFPIGSLASSFGLLRLPRVREILGKKVEGFKQEPIVLPNADVWHTTEMETEKAKIDVALREEKKKEKREKETQKQKVLAKSLKGSAQRKRKKLNSFVDLDQIAEEERLAKRMRRGKLSKEEFESAVAELDGDLELDE